jgi:hypothetical protein
VKLGPFGKAAAIVLSLNGFAGGALGGQPQTLGFVLSEWHTAVFVDGDTCPDGWQYDNEANWKAQFPTKEAQDAHFSRCGSPQNRGPNCENVWYNPTLATDLLPYREAQSKTSYGMNLDGDTQGSGTGKTCAHKKFVSPQGEPGIDNQMYRLLGCNLGKQKGGLYDSIFNQYRIGHYTWTRFLLEVTGVDDEMNDDDVTVTIYKDRDSLVLDKDGKAVPFNSQRVNVDAKQYILSTRGRIVYGVLTTEPMRFRFPIELDAARIPGDFVLDDARLRLKLGPTGAEGMLAGYHDIDTWWNMSVKMYSQSDVQIKGSGPSMWEAIHRLADGHKDPATGQCSAISAAYNLALTRIYIIHPDDRRNMSASVARVSSKP